MKVILKRKELINALNSVSRLTSIRSTLPILQNVYFGAENNELIIRATNLEQTVESVIEAEVTESGTITIPLRLFLDSLQNNTDEIVTISSDDLSILIKSSNHQVKLKGLAAEDYPTSQKVDVDFEFNIDQQELNKAVNHCIFATALDDTRPILTGLLFKFIDKKLVIVGTDGYRLAKYEVSNIEGKGEFIVPKKTLLELQKLLDNGNTVVSVGQNQIQFKVNKKVLISRLIDGNYPAFESIIPKIKTLEVSGAGTSLLNSLKMASLFSRESSYSTQLSVEGSRLKLLAKSPHTGESQSEVAVENSSKNNFEVSLNAQYLIDVLSVYSGEFKIEFNTQGSPVVLRFLDEDNYMYLVMPLRND